MIRRIDTDALRAKRVAIEQEIARHRDAIAALEQKRSELDIGERVIAEFAIEQSQATAMPTDERAREAMPTPAVMTGRPRKPDGLPTMPEMILAAFTDAHARGIPGLGPADVAVLVRNIYWPDAPIEAISPVVWRMWSKDRILGKKGSLYFLPSQPHNGGDTEYHSGSKDLLTEGEKLSFVEVPH